MSLQTVDILWHGKEHTPSWARTHDLSITYRVPLSIVMSQILKAMHLKYIFIYQGLQTKKLYTKMTKIWNADVKWQPIWILRLMEKTMPFTAWYTAEMDSAQTIHIETINEVLSPKMPTGLYLKLYFRSWNNGMSCMSYYVLFNFLFWLTAPSNVYTQCTAECIKLEAYVWALYTSL